MPPQTLGMAHVVSATHVAMAYYAGASGASPVPMAPDLTTTRESPAFHPSRPTAEPDTALSDQYQKLLDDLECSATRARAAERAAESYPETSGISSWRRRGRAPPGTPNVAFGREAKAPTRRQKVRGPRTPRNEQESKRREQHRELFERLRRSLKLPRAGDERVLVQAVRFLKAARDAERGGESGR